MEMKKPEGGKSQQTADFSVTMTNVKVYEIKKLVFPEWRKEKTNLVTGYKLKTVLLFISLFMVVHITLSRWARVIRIYKDYTDKYIFKIILFIFFICVKLSNDTLKLFSLHSKWK